LKSIIAACAVLLLFAGACQHDEDTGHGALWVRTVEPHLSTTGSWHECTSKLSQGHAVANAQCEAAPAGTLRCDVRPGTREEANRMLMISQPQCTDEAIASLESLSHTDAAAMSDLAGAYYVRAQRKDDPADLLRAFDNAQRAVAMTPRPTGAEFNRALILAALSLNAEAIEAWGRAAETEGGQWAVEARARQSALAKKTARDGERQWADVRAGIDVALDAQNVAEAERLIRAFPASAQRYFEDVVLAQWAKDPSPRQLTRVTTFAEGLSRSFQDHYFTDVAAALVNTRQRDRLRQAHLRFAEARGAGNSIDYSAAWLYEDAARLFQEAGSPQQLVARVDHAGQSALVRHAYDEANRELDDVLAEADRRRYSTVVARVNLNRLYTYQFLNRYNDLFDAYKGATAAYDRFGDWEDSAAATARVIATMSVLGLKDAAWRAAFIALRETPQLVSLRTQHLLVGSAANAALDLNHAEAALLYQKTVVVNARRSGVPPTYVVSALDHLAGIELSLQRYGDARRHLDEAAQENVKNADPKLRQALDIRLAQVQGAAALPIDPGKAVASLTEAINAATKSEFATLLAALFAERAEAFTRLGKPAQAEADRTEALRRLHTEETRMLASRKPGTADDLWNFYFARFEETYDLLIRQLIDKGRVEEAFRLAERARAFEPLDLVRKLPNAPAAFRQLAAQPENLDIGRLRAVLPPGTFLIEYRVFDDKTYVWVAGRDLFVGKWLTARRSDVKRWVGALQEAAARKDSKAFDDALFAPYEALLKVPLELVHSDGPANIVIVPDRELRGLPFAALRNPDTRRYAIEDNAFSMSGSALLYAFAVLRDRDLATGDDSALLVADPAFDPSSTLAEGFHRLPFARREADKIRIIYPHHEVLMDEAATPEAFLRLAGRNAIVHIAAHGVVNGDAPSQSFLLFNGVLTAEMLMKQLHTAKTRLVVLGACSSAGGLPVGTEGIAPLVRPMIGAGVPGVVGALWDIDDATADRLLVSFHRHYRQGAKAATALRDAQLEMLRSNDPGPQPARLWAPFQVIGHASSPFASVGDIKKEKPP
jgi:CHAT domain-containing protein